MKRASERLLARLRACPLLDLPGDAQLLRTHASRNTLANGAWSWSVCRANFQDLGIGSQYPMGDLLRSRQLIVFRAREEWFVIPKHAFAAANDRETWIEPLGNSLARRT